MGLARIAWNEKTQLRVAATSTILPQLKGVQMEGLAPAVSAHIQKLRDEEIIASLRDRHARMGIYTLCK